MAPGPDGRPDHNPALPKRRLPAAALASWAALILVLSVAPISSVPPLPVEILSMDTLMHALFYAPLGALFFWTFPHGKKWRACLQAAAAAFAFGATLEIVQALIPYRHFEWSDGLANLAGGGTGALIAALWPRRLLRPFGKIIR